MKQENKKRDTKMMTLNIPAELFVTIKKAAIDNNCTMTKLVLRAVVDSLVKSGEIEGP